MSRQLTLSACTCAAAMALFAIMAHGNLDTRSADASGATSTVAAPASASVTVAR